MATGGVGGPAAGRCPCGAVAVGVAVDGDDEDVLDVVDDGLLVGAQAAVVQGDVVVFGNEKGGVEAVGVEL